MARYLVSEKKTHFKIARIPKGESSKLALKIYSRLGHKGKIVTACSQQKAIAQFTKKRR